MGIGISTAILMANCGYTIELVDLKERESGQEFTVLEQAQKEIISNLELLKDLGEIELSPEDMLANLKLTYGSDKGLLQSKIVFEALPERPEIKQDFIKRIEPVIDRQSIIASATATISYEGYHQPEHAGLSFFLSQF